jgi:hypothetical protein
MVWVLPLQRFLRSAPGRRPGPPPGIFNGASFVFFSFIGFDCVSRAATSDQSDSCLLPPGLRPDSSGPLRLCSSDSG